MIRDLALTDVGPTRSLSFDFSKRLNVLTGDNGLGKTFVLEVLWWLLTTNWVGQPALPWRPPQQRESSNQGVGPPAPTIEARLAANGAEEGVRGEYQWKRQAWRHTWRESDRFLSDTGFDIEPWRDEVTPPGLVVFARIDGSFAVWDAYQTEDDGFRFFTHSTVNLDAHELWYGKQGQLIDLMGRPRQTLIRGLLDDWVSWQGTNASEFSALCEVLTLLSDPHEPLVPGTPGRVFLQDRRDIPTLSMPYGEVPVTLASAGMKRVLGLAYLLVWTWSEHRKAAKLTQREPVREMTLLIDEVELHLHPSWQRLLLPAVLRAIDKLAPDCAVQVFATTHSPMVLASLESVFDESIDDLFVLERDGQAVRVNDLPWAKEGDVSNWLLSEAFGKVGSRSREAELAIAAAKAFMEDRPDDAEQALVAFLERIDALPDTAASDDDRLATARGDGELAARIQAALEATLPGHDEFWVQWSLVYRLPQGRRGSAA